MPNLYSQDLRIEESPKTWDLGDKFFPYNDLSAQSKKIGKTSSEKSRREKKEQYHLQQTWDLGIPTTNTNVAHNSGVQNDRKCKNLSLTFNCDKKSYYADKCLKPKKSHYITEN